MGERFDLAMPPRVAKELRGLDSRHAFVARIRYRTHRVIETHSKTEVIPSKKWETLKDDNPELYRQLYVPR
jgi:hypothetical protein